MIKASIVSNWTDWELRLQLRFECWLNRVDRVNITSGITELIVIPRKRAVLCTLPLSNQEDIPLIIQVKYNSTLLPSSILNVKPDL